MLLPGQRPSTVICIYMFDIRYAVFVFDLKGRWSPHPPVRGEEGFDVMVPTSAFPFRKADPDELRYALAAVRAMPESAYESVSEPAWDFGWYQVYGDRQGIEKIIEDKLQEQQDLESAHKAPDTDPLSDCSKAERRETMKGSSQVKGKPQ